MIDITYNGNTYKLIKDRTLLDRVNVLFAGYIFLDGRRFKKYINCDNRVLIMEV